MLIISKAGARCVPCYRAAASPLGVRTAEENKTPVTCLPWCCCLHLPRAFYAKDALLHLPNQPFPGIELSPMSLVGEVHLLTRSAIPCSALESNSHGRQGWASVFLSSQINSLLKVEVIPVDKKESFWAGVGMAGNIQTQKRGLGLSEVMWPDFLEEVADHLRTCPCCACPARPLLISPHAQQSKDFYSLGWTGLWPSYEDRNWVSFLSSLGVWKSSLLRARARAGYGFQGALLPVSLSWLSSEGYGRIL